MVDFGVVLSLVGSDRVFVGVDVFLDGICSFVDDVCGLVCCVDGKPCRDFVHCLRFKDFNDFAGVVWHCPRFKLVSPHG